MTAPFSHSGSPCASSAPVRADLAVNLSGWHVAETVSMASSILMVFPSTRLTITHPHLVQAALTAWRDAERLAAEVLPQTAARPPAPEATVSARVFFTAPVTGIQIDALSARASASGAAQVRVRLGVLLIITADRDAVACQLRLWQTAARHADRLWPAAPAQTTPVDPTAPGHPAVPAALERISA